MKISFDAQLFLGENKTGIGWCADNIVRELAGDPDKQLQANYFTVGRSAADIQGVTAYTRYGVGMNPCKWFHNALYKLLWPVIPIPYHWFFGTGADVTIFFNFIVPPGVKGRTIAVVHDMAYLAYPETVRSKTRNWLRLTLKKSCERADAIVTVSEFSKQEIMRYLHIPAEKITVMPNGVDLENYHPNHSADEMRSVRSKFGIPERYFLYLGTLEPRKNIERILDAYKKYAESAKDAVAMVLAGGKGWMYDGIFQKVKDCGLADHVIFTGYVSTEDAAALMQGARAFIFPSLYEGFGMPPLEAMACGTPVLTADASSLPEVVGNAGILVDPMSVEAICAGMKRLAEDDALCGELSRKGILRAREFTWKRSSDVMRDVLGRMG